MPTANPSLYLYAVLLVLILMGPVKRGKLLMFDKAKPAVRVYVYIYIFKCILLTHAFTCINMYSVLCHDSEKTWMKTTHNTYLNK